MTLLSDSLRQELLETDGEFRRWATEHSNCDRRLEQLQAKPYQRPEDEWEELRLKKLRLRAKDRMEELVRLHRRKQTDALQAT